jgi:predicted transposase/invertase (TIGR01784 family)
MDKYSALIEAEEKGIEKGIVKGERKKAIDASKKMIQDGLPLELISKYEGLSIHELEKIKEMLQNENQ